VINAVQLKFSTEAVPRSRLNKQIRNTTV